MKRSTELDVQEETEVVIDEEYLPDLVREIFSDVDELEKSKPSKKTASQNTLPKAKAKKKTSQDSGNPPSDSSEASKPSTWPRQDPKLGGQSLRNFKKNSPQLEAVRKMDAMRKTGHKTRKYNADLEDEEGTATLIYDRKTKSWKLEMKSAVNAQVCAVLFETHR